MARTTRPRRDTKARMEALLPLDTPDGCIAGLVCDDYMVGTALSPYQRCCQDVRTWQPSGPIRPLLPPRRTESGMLLADPYYGMGFRSHRAVICGVCGGSVIGTEYRYAAVREEG
jgi:hypothetical protein